MKKAMVLLAMVLTVGSLSACGAAGTEEAEAPEEFVEVEHVGAEESSQEEPEETAQEPEMEEDASQADSGLDNFDADPEKVAAYARSIQEAVAAKDLEKLADLTGFPVYVGLEGVDIVETREDFLALDPEAVFSEEMVSSIANTDISALEPSMAGFTMIEKIEAPGITFGMVNGEFRITGINY